MISPISSVSVVPQAESQPKPVASPAPATSAVLPNDTVHISAQGQAAAASGDVDHDGDSH